MTAATTTEGNAVRVLLLLGPSFEDAEAAVALTACAWTQYRPDLPKVQVTICAMEPTVTGHFGTAFTADVLLDEVDPTQYQGLVIPGGFRANNFESLHNKRTYQIIRAMRQNNAPIATMCVGILPVAKAGEMQGLRATTYEFSRRNNYQVLADHGAVCVHKPVVEDQGIISCSGPSYSEQVMQRFLELLIGAEQANIIQRFRSGISEDYL